MVFAQDHIRNLISQVTESNLPGVCEKIHRHMRPENGHDTIHTIATCIIHEAAGPGHTLVPQYNLAGVCWTIHDLCSTPGGGAGEFLPVSLPKKLDELCQKEFVDATRKLENEDGEEASSIVLDLVVLVGEVYKLGLVGDEVMKNVYLENLHCGYKGSDDKAQAMCLLLELVATRWEMDPTSRNIDVERYVQSLLGYVERHDPPSELVKEIQVGSVAHSRCGANPDKRRRRTLLLNLAYKIIPHRIPLAQILTIVENFTPLRNLPPSLLSPKLPNNIRSISLMTEMSTSFAVRMTVPSSSAYMVNDSSNTPRSYLASYHKRSFTHYPSPTVGPRSLGTTTPRNSPLC